MEQSVLTPQGEMFVTDLIDEVRNGPDDYFISDLCDDWGLEYDMGTVQIPATYQSYGRVVKRESPPLLLKTLIGHPTERKIRKASRDPYPYFHHELFGEVCIWQEALRRGSPHTELFAPVYDYGTDYDWAVVGRATNVLHRGTDPAKRLEDRAEELGWAADDTEVGTFEDSTVAVDYGGWWRHDDAWITDIGELPITYHGYNDGRNTRSGPAQTASPTTTEEPSRPALYRLQQWILSRFS